MKTSELTKAALDWAVAKCEGYPPLALTHSGKTGGFFKLHAEGHHNYSTNWSQGGPIIEREGIAVVPLAWKWQAQYEAPDLSCHVLHGDTPLIAAMRCYVASKLGDDVEIPEELLK